MSDEHKVKKKRIYNKDHDASLLKMLEQSLLGNCHDLTRIEDMIHRISKIPCFRSDIKIMEDFYLSHSEKGNTHAMWLLAVIYHSSVNPFSDDKVSKCLQLLERASSLNNPYGHAYLGMLYESGIGVTKSQSKALELYKASVSQCCCVGQHLLAEMYREGKGVDLSIAEAEKLYRQAAIQNYSKSISYFEGKGPRELTKILFEELDLIRQSREELRAKVTELTEFISHIEYHPDGLKFQQIKADFYNASLKQNSDNDNDNNIQLPNLIFGTHKLSEIALTYAIESGLSMLDTATAYNNAELMEKAFKITKKYPTVLTKFNSKDFDNIEEIVKSHVKELGVEPKIILLHSPLTSLEKNIIAFKDIRRLFPNAYIGVSNFDIRQIQNLIDNGCQLDLVSIEFHPYYQPNKLLLFCKDKKIKVTGYRTFAKGIALNDPLIIKLADKYQCSTSDILLKWSLVRGVTPTVSSAKFENIKKLVEFDNFRHKIVIDEEDIDKINSLNKDSIGSTCMTKYCPHDN